MVKLTLFGRALLLLISELTANAVCWIAAGVLFGRSQNTRPILSLTLLAWTLGLRHALDADHISAIDNATRGLINLEQLPVTCGLFFSLGHSTIVVVVTVAIAISSDVYNKIHGVGTVGGIVGASVSGAFLFIVALANTIILWRIIKQRRRDKEREKRIEKGEALPRIQHNPKHNHMLMMRILGPVITFVNRPWKMYPVGVLFGFGFDTASSIALLAVSALAKRGSNGKAIPSSHIVILPLLFTAGMTLIDSADSILMLYSYSGFPEHSWAVFESRRSKLERPHTSTIKDENNRRQRDCATGDSKGREPSEHLERMNSKREQAPDNVLEDRITRDTRVKMNVMSGLSIILTLMSILVAFSISLITIMGLIGEQCSQCAAAAGAENGGGLAGSWWRAWARANDNSGYIGAAIVGAFLLIVVGWYGGGWAAKKIKA